MIRKVRFFGRSAMWQVVRKFSFCCSEGHSALSDFWPNLNFLLEHQIKLVLRGRRSTEIGNFQTLIKLRSLVVRT